MELPLNEVVVWRWCGRGTSMLMMKFKFGNNRISFLFYNMKTLTLVIAFFAVCITNSFGQTSWSKESKSNIYSDCQALLANSSATTEQKETVCICFTEEITKKYSRSEIEDKLEVELKRIKKSAVEACAKVSGVELVAQPKVEPKLEVKTSDANNVLSSSAIVGLWEDETGKIWFYESGDYKHTKVDGSEIKGSWKLDGDMIYFYRERLFGTSIKGYKILIFTNSSFVYQNTEDKRKTYKAVRVK